MPADLTQAWLLSHPRKPDPANADVDAFAPTTAADVGFPEKVCMAVLRVAKIVRAEPPITDPTKADERRLRQQLATNVLSSTVEATATGLRFASLLATQATIDAAATDAQIVNQVTQFWNAMAGVLTDQGTVQ